MKKIIDIVFVGFIGVFLTLGLVTTLFFPKDVNYYENRPANKIEAFSVREYLAGTFQSQVSNALNDQVPASPHMKKAYNYLNSSYEKAILSSVQKLGGDNRYYLYKGGKIFGDYLVYGINDFESRKEPFNARFENVKSAQEAHEDIDFYVYYIEKDTDIDFETNEKAGFYKYLQEGFGKIDVPFSGFKINSFDEFAKYFYKTDHHWNHAGSYKGYVEVMNMMNPDVQVLEPIEEYLWDYKFSGSKASMVGATDIMSEKFPAYRFDYPNMEVAIDGKAAEDYGRQKDYQKEKQSGITYGSYYGGDYAEVIFNTGKTEKENVLIVGESYDNAILKLVASHYGKTYSIDLRAYENTFG